AIEPSESGEPFGLFTFRAPAGILWVKWIAAQDAIREDQEVLAKCRGDISMCASPAARRFLAIIGEARALEGRARIEVVNRSINAAIRYMTDLAQHGVLDLWSAPLATLTSGQGDCEDNAIAKYVALRETGLEADELRLLLVRDRAVGEDHAVLAARHDGRWLILDNRHVALNEAADLRQFTLLFALDHEGVKLFATPYAARSRRENELEIAPAAPAKRGATAAPSGAYGMLILM